MIRAGCGGHGGACRSPSCSLLYVFGRLQTKQVWALLQPTLLLLPLPPPLPLCAGGDAPAGRRCHHAAARRLSAGPGGGPHRDPAVPAAAAVGRARCLQAYRALLKGGRWVGAPLTGLIWSFAALGVGLRQAKATAKACPVGVYNKPKHASSVCLPLARQTHAHLPHPACLPAPPRPALPCLSCPTLLCVPTHRCWMMPTFGTPLSATGSTCCPSSSPACPRTAPSLLRWPSCSISGEWMGHGGMRAVGLSCLGGCQQPGSRR